MFPLNTLGIESLVVPMTHCGRRCGCHDVAGQRGGEEGGRHLGSPQRTRADPRGHGPRRGTPLRAGRARMVRAAVAVLTVQKQLPPKGGGAEALLHPLAGVLAEVVVSWSTRPQLG